MLSTFLKQLKKVGGLHNPQVVSKALASAKTSSPKAGNKGARWSSMLSVKGGVAAMLVRNGILQTEWQMEKF